MWTIKIPKWFPPSLNLSRGRHAARSHKLTKECHEFTATYAMSAGVPLITEEYRPVRRVTIDVTKEGTAPDPDNLLKNLLDGLKLSRLIVDDKAKWCKWERPEIHRVPKGTPGQGTVIVIADVDEPVHTEPLSSADVRARDLYADLSRVATESTAVSTGDMLWDAAEALAPNWFRAEQLPVVTAPVPAGKSLRLDVWPEFTRAVVERTVWHKGMSNDPRNFTLWFRADGAEQVWLSYTSAVSWHVERLVNWCEALGVPVQYVEPPPEKPAPAPKVLPNPDLFG